MQSKTEEFEVWWQPGSECCNVSGQRRKGKADSLDKNEYQIKNGSGSISIWGWGGGGCFIILFFSQLILNVQSSLLINIHILFKNQLIYSFLVSC